MFIQPIFCGYASVFNHQDIVGDIILPGAFCHSLQKDEKNIKLLWQHNPALPLGVINKIYEDTKGLFIEGEMLLDIKYVYEAFLLIQKKAVHGLSVGFEVLESFYGKDARYIKKAKLWEVSVVTFPANTQATITMVGGNGLEPSTSTMST